MRTITASSVRMAKRSLLSGRFRVPVLVLLALLAGALHPGRDLSGLTCGDCASLGCVVCESCGSGGCEACQECAYGEYDPARVSVECQADPDRVRHGMCTVRNDQSHSITVSLTARITCANGLQPSEVLKDVRVGRWATTTVPFSLPDPPSSAGAGPPACDRIAVIVPRPIEGAWNHQWGRPLDPSRDGCLDGCNDGCRDGTNAGCRLIGCEQCGGPEPKKKL